MINFTRKTIFITPRSWESCGFVFLVQNFFFLDYACIWELKTLLPLLCTTTVQIRELVHVACCPRRYHRHRSRHATCALAIRQRRNRKLVNFIECAIYRKYSLEIFLNDGDEIINVSLALRFLFHRLLLRSTGWNCTHFMQLTSHTSLVILQLGSIECWRGNYTGRPSKQTQKHHKNSALKI